MNVFGVKKKIKKKRKHLFARQPVLRRPFYGRRPDRLSCPPPTPKERDLQDDLNVIIFSDHGMTDISWTDKVIKLDNYINLRDLQQLKGRGPVMSLWPAPGKHSEVRRVGGGPSQRGTGVSVVGLYL